MIVNAETKTKTKRRVDRLYDTCPRYLDTFLSASGRVELVEQSLSLGAEPYIAPTVVGIFESYGGCHTL